MTIWIELEVIMLNEICQVQKDRYCTVYIWNFKKLI
jgi:hypothetical protein